MAEKDRSFNVVLAPVDSERLEALARLHRTSQGAITRQAIAAKFAMEIAREPTCADGRPCLVPHMHPPPSKE